MSKRTSGHQGPEDVNEIAFRVVSEATSGAIPDAKKGKLPAAVELGRLGGLRGGPARAQKMPAEERSRIAKVAAMKRWEGRKDG